MTTTTSVLAVEGGTPVSLDMVPFMHTALSEADIDSALGVLRSGMLRQAGKCAELEERIGGLSGARFAHTCANGTCALQLAYQSLLDPGDEVIVPASTYIATASMIVGSGMTPVFCDALEDTMQIDPGDIEHRITPRTRAIAATHLYGCPADIDAVQSIADKHGLKVVYDSAQAHLAQYNGRGIGAFGDAVTYSFYATKNLATGEGGMITTNDEGVSRKIQLLRSHGETDKYLHESIGFNYRMNDITAAVGCSRLDRLEAETERRREVASTYDGALADVDAIRTPTITEGATPVYHLYVVKLDLGRVRCTRDEFCAALKGEGVPTAVHYPRPLTRQPAFAAWVDRQKPEVPVSERLAERVFALPMHPALTDEHVGVVTEAVRKVADAYAV